MSDTDWSAKIHEALEREVAAQREALAAVVGRVAAVETVISVDINATNVPSGPDLVLVDALEIRVARFPGSPHDSDKAGALEVIGVGHRLTKNGKKGGAARIALPKDLASPYILDALTKG